MLSEHTLEGWLEGYVLTGRHGLFNTYEAFVHIIDSMYNQHAKWLEKSKLELDWRAPISSLNILIIVAGLAAGPQRFYPSGSRLSRSGQQQERRCNANLSASRCELPAQRGGSLPAQQGLRKRDCRRQAAPPASISTWRPRSFTAPKASESGTGPATTREWSRMWWWRARATS